MYTKEAEDQRVKLDELIGGNGEEWYIKNAVRGSFSRKSAGC